MKNKVSSFLKSTLCLLFWIAVWYLAAELVNRNLILKIPLPHETAAAFLKNARTPSFWKAVLLSSTRIATGFSAAAVLGTILGIMSEISPFFKRLFSPLLHLVRAVPIAAFTVVAWLFLPTSLLPVFIPFLMVLPIIWSHTEAGISSEDKQVVEMAKSMGVKGFPLIFKVRVPYILPSVRHGAISGLGIAWKSGVAAEVICSPVGSLGALLSSAKRSIDYEEVFAVTLAVVLLSLIFENLLKLLWKEQKR